jgi:hypothetical protein
MNDDQCRQLLDRAGHASWRAYDRSADGGLMESYGPVWPDIHDRAVNSPDHFRSLTRALVISGMTPQEAQAKIGSREE